MNDEIGHPDRAPTPEEETDAERSAAEVDVGPIGKRADEATELSATHEGQDATGPPL